MAKSAKVAISLPEDLLTEIETQREASRETRSEFFRRAVEAFLRRERQREDIAQYIRGYQRYPETLEEAAVAEATMMHAFVENPWDGEGDHETR